jgi:peptidoglycan/xylan/chitin deacetylase (PgdA/CDA1 family)
VLAADPATAPVPLAAAAAVVNPKCPPAPSGVQSVAPGSGKTVALTFDDGPGPSTAQLLNILQNSGVAATFFNIGVNQTVRPVGVRSEAVLEAPLGNHTWSHPRMPTLSAAAQAAEMDRTSAEQVALVGSAPCLFRPPYGEYNATTLTLAQQRRMAVWNWSVDTEDWKAGTSTSPDWVNRIVSRAVAGGSQQHPVILMHNPPAGLPATVTALPQIIAYYRSHGYTFVDLAGHVGQRPTPAAAVTTAGRHLLVRGPTGAVLQRTGTATTWGGWASLGGGVVGGPTAVAANSVSTAVFVTGTDNKLYWKSVGDDGATSGWGDLGGLATSRPGVALGPDGRLSVVVRGGTGGAYLKERVGGVWGGWQPLGGQLASGPAAAVAADGGLTVAMVGTDQALWVRHRGATWGAWHRVGGTITAEPALSATAGGGRLAAVVRGADNAAYVSVADPTGTTWSGWTSLGGRLSSGLAVTTDGTALDVFTYGTDDRIYLNVATGGAAATGWTGWRALPA